MNLQMAVLDLHRMSEADRLTVAAGTTGIELMDHAGAAVANAIEKRWAARPVVVLCGPGNNGGDGFVVARRLAGAGWPVRVALLGSRDGLTAEARHHTELWAGAVEPLSPAALAGAELVVDVLFGAGLARKLSGQAADTLAAAARATLTIVSVDVPSGVMGDTGESLGAVSAALTVTYLRKRPCHVLLPGRSLCGEVVVADIGTPATVLERLAPDTFENDPLLWLPALPRPSDVDDKHTRGHARVAGQRPAKVPPAMARRCEVVALVRDLRAAQSRLRRHNSMGTHSRKPRHCPPIASHSQIPALETAPYWLSGPSEGGSSRGPDLAGPTTTAGVHGCLSPCTRSAKYSRRFARGCGRSSPQLPMGL